MHLLLTKKQRSNNVMKQREAGDSAGLFVSTASAQHDALAVGRAPDSTSGSVKMWVRIRRADTCRGFAGSWLQGALLPARFRVFPAKWFRHPEKTDTPTAF